MKRFVSLAFRHYSGKLMLPDCRPVELIATASTAGTRIWSLKGKANDLQVRVMAFTCMLFSSTNITRHIQSSVNCASLETHSFKLLWFAQVHQMSCLSSDGQTALDCLPVDGQVWKVEFDKMGSLLATSASDGDDSNVCIWALNPEGQWYLLSTIVGAPHQSEDNAGMLE